MELWKDMPISAGRYKVSNFGNIKRKDGYIMSQYISHRGYKMTGLTVNGKQKGFLVHRLVAEAFIPNPYNKPFINHKDGDKLNNNANNLEWCTNSENQLHSCYVLKNPNHKCKRVECVETGEVFESSMDVQRKTGFCSSNICRAAKNKDVVCHGYHWRYVKSH